MLQNFTLNYKPIHTYLIISLLLLPLLLSGQNAVKNVAISRDGTMRWVDTGNELTGFGVNYTVPFAHAYRKAKEMGIDIKQVIDQDVAQFARLNLDLFRVHVWDCEISDTLGNLLENEHLDLFDYLLFKLKENKIKSMITPIAYWGNGWPDPDEKTPGFSAKYGKEECLVNPQALEAQKRYITQFVAHRNKYTGQAYKDDPDIILFEISNEPHHKGEHEIVKTFINTLSKAYRDAGNSKPVFYNVTHSINLTLAYQEARIDGGTFQWYPTGLGYQKPITGNMLPHVDNYAIPFDESFKAKGLARIVYEFDAADMMSSYMYPAMARSFRTAGMQLATHFSYDPTFLAPFNTEYNTHFMNLAYAPGKAISLMICGEVFRQMPRYRSYGRYPANSTFGPFTVDADKDLAEMITPTHYYYTNNSDSKIHKPELLEHIAGVGNSNMVSCSGTGAYFMDKLEDGAWLLELYPNPMVYDNVFGRNNTATPRAQLIYEPRYLKILLPGLENAVAIDIKSDQIISAGNGVLELMPGRYILSASSKFNANRDFSNLKNKAKSVKGITQMESLSYSKPSSKINIDTTYSWSAGFDMPVDINIASPQPISNLVVKHKGKEYPFTKKDGFNYEAIIPGNLVKEGEFKFEILWNEGGSKKRFPEKGEQIRSIKNSNKEISLLDDRVSVWAFHREWVNDSTLNSRIHEKSRVLDVYLGNMIRTDPENPKGVQHADYSINLPLFPYLQGRRSDLPLKKTLVVEVASAEEFPVQIGLVQSDGSMVAQLIKTEKGMKTYRIPLESLEPADQPILPRPYPTFLPYYFPKVDSAVCQPGLLESLMISFGPGMTADQWPLKHHWTIGKIWLE